MMSAMCVLRLRRGMLVTSYELRYHVMHARIAFAEDGNGSSWETRPRVAVCCLWLGAGAARL
eukprot:3526664-Prymnesium_polylepis.1